MCAWGSASERVLETDHIGRNSSFYHVTIQLSTRCWALATKSGYSDPLRSALFYTLLPLSPMDLALFSPTLSFTHCSFLTVSWSVIYVEREEKSPREQMDRESKNLGRSDLELFFEICLHLDIQPCLCMTKRLQQPEGHKYAHTHKPGMTSQQRNRIKYSAKRQQQQSYCAKALLS